MGTRKYARGGRAGWGRPPDSSPQATDCLKLPSCSDPIQHLAGGWGAGWSCPASGPALSSSGHGLPSGAWAGSGRTGPLSPTMGPGTGWPGRGKCGAPGCRLLAASLPARASSVWNSSGKMCPGTGAPGSWFGGLWVLEAWAGLWPYLPPPAWGGGSQLLLAMLPLFSSLVGTGACWPHSWDALWGLSPGAKGAPASCPPRLALSVTQIRNLSAWGCTGVESGEFRPL